MKMEMGRWKGKGDEKWKGREEKKRGNGRGKWEWDVKGKQWGREHKMGEGCENKQCPWAPTLPGVTNIRYA